MKNKYLKGSHISERKMSELLQLFCEDHTATQIAGITGISRITANAYLKLLRNHIAAFCEERNPSQNGYKTVIEQPKPSNGVRSDQKKCLFGLRVAHDFVYTAKLEGPAVMEAYERLKSKNAADSQRLKEYPLEPYQGIIDFNTSKLLPIARRNQKDWSPETASALEEAEKFWSMLRSRIVKFRGLNNSTLFLHVKETEFRYNYRNENIYGLLLGIIQKKPLHLSRA